MKGSTHWRRNPKIKSIYMSIHSWRLHEIEEAPPRSTVHEGQTCSLVRKCALSILQSSQITSETTFSKVSTASSEIKFTLVIPCPILFSGPWRRWFLQRCADDGGPTGYKPGAHSAANWKGSHLQGCLWLGGDEVHHLDWRGVDLQGSWNTAFYIRHIPSVGLPEDHRCSDEKEKHQKDPKTF